MKMQAFNPYLPNYEYIPDAEPHIFDGRVYIYGSHDKFGGISFCLNDYVCYSAPLYNLADWRFEGVIYQKKQDPCNAKGFMNSMFAPDVCKGADGRYYLYYFIGFSSRIAVAVCSEPAGKYEFYGYVKYEDGKLLGSKKEPLQFDPGVFCDDDGRFYLYTGFAPVRSSPLFLGGHKPTKNGAMGFELMSDMLTITSPPVYIGVPSKHNAKDSDFEGHEFFEAASMRKFNGKYYFIYSSFLGHELCYAVSDNPLSGFKFGGTLVSMGDIGINGHSSPKNACNFTGNTHGSIIEINGRYFVFYHRQTNRHQFSRQACAEEVFMQPDGSFLQSEVTSCGLNGKPLIGKGEYPAAIACNLYCKNGARFYGVFRGLKGTEPYFTQTGKDRENNPDQYIANICDGTVIGFKYFEICGASEISVKIKGNSKGKIRVLKNAGEFECLAEIEICPSKTYMDFYAPLKIENGKTALFFKFEGKGTFDFKSFELF